jgi:hypothetical protein
LLGDNPDIKNGTNNDLSSGTIVEVNGYIDDQGQFQAKQLKFENESKINANHNFETNDVINEHDSNDNDNKYDRDNGNDDDDDDD